MGGRSPIRANEEEQCALRGLARSAQRGEADRARAILLTLEGLRAEDIAHGLSVNVSTVREWRGLYARGGVDALRYLPRSGGRPGTAGRQALSVAKEILAEDVSHDGHWTLPRLCAEIERRGGGRVSQPWLSVLLRKKDIAGGARATRSPDAKMPPPSSAAAYASSC
jgi:transposase